MWLFFVSPFSCEIVQKRGKNAELMWFNAIYFHSCVPELSWNSFVLPWFTFKHGIFYRNTQFANIAPQFKRHLVILLLLNTLKTHRFKSNGLPYVCMHQINTFNNRNKLRFIEAQKSVFFSLVHPIIQFYYDLWWIILFTFSFKKRQVFNPSKWFGPRHANC